MHRVAVSIRAQDLVELERLKGVPLKPTDFAWSSRRRVGLGGHREGRASSTSSPPCTHKDIHRGKAIGVAVSDSPTGPFVDARGTALVTNDMTKATNISWDDIDPTVFIDDDGQAWLFWGNQKCYYAKLKDRA